MVFFAQNYTITQRHAHAWLPRHLLNEFRDPGLLGDRQISIPGVWDGKEWWPQEKLKDSDTFDTQ